MSRRALAPGAARRRCLFAAAALGAVAVALGAFGAHAMSERLEPRLLETWATATRYLFWHVLAVLAATGVEPLWRGRAIRTACLCWLVGIIVFSGSLYLLCLTGLRALGAVTPFGGILLVAGWLALAAAALRLREAHPSRDGA